MRFAQPRLLPGSLRSVLGLLFCSPIFLAFAQPAARDPQIAEFDRLIKSERYQEAEPALERFTASHADSAEGWYQLGYVYFQTHKIWPSVKALSKSLSLNPQQAHAHRILGLDFTILGRLDLARRELERTVELDPKSADGHYSLGRVLYEEGFYGLAAEHLERSASLRPEDVKTLHNLGLTYEALNQLDRSREAFEKALTFNDKSPRPSEWPYINYGSFLNRRFEFAEAVSVLEKGREIQAKSDPLEFELGKAYRGLGKLDLAATALEKARQLNPGNSDYLYVLAFVYRSLGRTNEATAALAEFTRLKKAQDAGQPVPVKVD